MKYTTIEQKLSDGSTVFAVEISEDKYTPQRRLIFNCIDHDSMVSFISDFESIIRAYTVESLEESD